MQSFMGESDLYSFLVTITVGQIKYGLSPVNGAALRPLAAYYRRLKQLVVIETLDR